MHIKVFRSRYIFGDWVATVSESDGYCLVQISVLIRGVGIR